MASDIRGDWKLRLSVPGGPGEFRLLASLEGRLHRWPQRVELRPIAFEKFAAGHHFRIGSGA